MNIQSYVNRKGYHSVILQAICSHDMRFTNCFVGWPGSCHDSRVLNSQFWIDGPMACGQYHTYLYYFCTMVVHGSTLDIWSLFKISSGSGPTTGWL
jgi:hypothetical protein